MISVSFAEAVRLEPADDVGVLSVLNHNHRDREKGKEVRAELRELSTARTIERFDIPIRHGSEPGQYHMERRQSVAFESKTNHEVITLSI